MNFVLKLAGVLGLIQALTFTAGSAQLSKPNFLLIVGDDMGYADVGFHGCKDIPTPHLDALAASGVRFTSGYVTGPYCSPTRAGLMTGRYQQRFGHEFNPGASTNGLPLSEVTIADRLGQAGYATGLVGKWHLGGNDRQHPMKRGFQEFFGFLGGAHSYVDWNGIQTNGKPATGTGYLTDAYGREASRFIERHQGIQPWFLYLAFNAVHTPLHATDERLAKLQNIQDPTRRKYAAMMVAMDENIGQVLKTLKATRQEEKTLVMFISDNGGPRLATTTINGSINDPLRGSKRTTLEGGIRVPFLISWKGKVKPAVYSEPVIQLDLTATMLHSAGIPVQRLDGVDLLPYLDGSASGVPHNDLYWRLGRQMAIRSGEYKLVRYDSSMDGPDASRTVVSTPKLYNLKNDIGETSDLSSAMPEKAAELQAKWDRWSATLKEPLWGADAPARPAKKGKKNKQGNDIKPRERNGTEPAS